MFIKILLLLVFFGVMIGIGLYCRRNATDVNGLSKIPAMHTAISTR